MQVGGYPKSSATRNDLTLNLFVKHSLKSYINAKPPNEVFTLTFRISNFT
jgi:hypothetical protein